MHGPLTGFRVLEFEGIGPAPHCGMLLAGLGADVVRIARPGADRGPLVAETGGGALDRGRTVVMLDLKTPEGQARALDLATRAEAVVEGLRPGVMERLGLGPEPCLAANPALVYCRLTGWGQTGPKSREVGHDINYIALSGALGAMGPADGPPRPPLNLVGDFGGGGLYAAFGILAGVLSARATGRGQVIDAAMMDGALAQMAMIYGMLDSGAWQDRKQANLLDGAAPFYRCYRCADGLDLAVGAIEPRFFAALLEGLGETAEDWDQTDRSGWPRMAAVFAGLFARHPRSHWLAIFDGTEACVSPVLGLAEAMDHPHNRARAAFEGPYPAPGPRFSGTPGAFVPPATLSVEEALARWDTQPVSRRMAGA